MLNLLNGEIKYLILGVIIIGIYAIAEWNNTKQIVYNLMLRAKDLAKDQILNCGQAQEDWVVEKLKLILPRRLMLFIDDATLRKLVKFLYNKGLDYLDDGKFNNSIQK